MSSCNPFRIFSFLFSNPITNIRVAIRRGRIDVIRRMLKSKKIDPNSALYYAVSETRPDIVSFIIENGVDLRCPILTYETVLHLVAIHWRSEIFNQDEMIKMEVNKILINAVRKLTPSDILSVAFIRKDHKTHVSAFLEACVLGLDDLVLILLDFITEKFKLVLTIDHLQDDFNRNPFHFMNKLKPQTIFQIIDTLPLAKELISSKDFSDTSPLHFAVVWREEIALRFISSGLVSADAVNGSGQTPLHCAIFHKRPSIVKELLKAGCRTDIFDCHGASPLKVALGLDDESIKSALIGFLLAYGVDLQKEPYLYDEDDSPEKFKGEELSRQRCVDNLDHDSLQRLIRLRISNDMNSLMRSCRNCLRRYLKSNADKVISNLPCVAARMRSFLLVENELLIDYHN